MEKQLTWTQQLIDNEHLLPLLNQLIVLQSLKSSSQGEANNEFKFENKTHPTLNFYKLYSDEKWIMQALNQAVTASPAIISQGHSGTLLLAIKLAQLFCTGNRHSSSSCLKCLQNCTMIQPILSCRTKSRSSL